MSARTDCVSRKLPGYLERDVRRAAFHRHNYDGVRRSGKRALGRKPPLRPPLPRAGGGEGWGERGGDQSIDYWQAVTVTSSRNQPSPVTLQSEIEVKQM